MLIANLLGNRLERKATHQECVYMGDSISTTVDNLHGLDGLGRACYTYQISDFTRHITR